MVKNCESCGKLFVPIKKSQKYCCKKCRIRAHTVARKAKYVRRNKNEQLCWRCKRATGNCPWSATREFIDGWKAKPITIKDGNLKVNTYHIKECPLFDEEKDYWERMIKG